MSQPQRGTGRPDDGGANLAWSGLFVVASVFGGLAAADITHESALVAAGFSLLVAVIMVLLLYQGFLDERPGAGRRAGEERRPGEEHWPAGDPRPGAAARQEPPGPPAGRGGAHRAVPERPQPPVSRQPLEPPVQPGVVRVVQPPGGGNWWRDHVAATPPAGRTGSPSSAPRARPPKVDLTQFLDQAQIAQCPRCGAFALDVDNRAAEWLFACKECGQRWPWQPGTPWPGITVRPEERGRPDRSRP